MDFAKQNRYFELANHFAMRARQIKARMIDLDNRLERLLIKYAGQLAESAGDQFTCILGTFAHIAMAMLAGINIRTILYAAQTDPLSGGTWEDAIRATLPVLGILGMSLVIGLALSKIQLKRDAVVPNKSHFNSEAVIVVVTGLAIYFFLLAKLMAIGEDMAEDKKNIVHLVLILGMIELFLGYFASKGWTFIFLHWRIKMFRLRRNRLSNRRSKARMRCENYYNYYQQLVNNPANLQMSELIEQTLSEPA